MRPLPLWAEKITARTEKDFIDNPIPPCGACRQVMTEFCKPNFEIILTDGSKIKTFKLEDVMPLGFSL